MNNLYWIIDYKITFLSDFHAGDGTTLLTGNTHGIRLDDYNQPYLPSTQVRGLIRQSGYTLKESIQPQLATLFERNFPIGSLGMENQQAPDSPRSWSFTRAEHKSSIMQNRFDSWGRQTHVKLNSKDIVENFFAYEKAGSRNMNKELVLEGRIYSVSPATQNDVFFLLACMRLEDRVGHRRTRGYGKVDWRWEKIRYFSAQSPVQELERKEANEIFAHLFKEASHA